MGNEIKYIELKNEKFPMVFSLNVIEAIQTEFGSLNDWKELIEPKDGGETNLKALLFAFKEAINEGIDIENENLHGNKSFISERKAGRIITELGLSEAGNQLKQIVVDSTKGDDTTEQSETKEKNVMTTQNQ
jgi:hypothetical protein